MNCKLATTLLLSCFVQVSDVLEVSSLPSQSMHMVLSLRGGQAPRYLFQTNHDAIIFQTTLLQVARHGGFMQNQLQPRGSCDLFGFMQLNDVAAMLLIIVQCWSAADARRPHCPASAPTAALEAGPHPEARARRRVSRSLCGARGLAQRNL
jgi:hypothetical protein